MNLLELKIEIDENCYHYFNGQISFEELLRRNSKSIDKVDEL